MWSEVTWFMWSDVKCSDVEWTDVIHVKWFRFEVKWSEVMWSDVGWTDVIYVKCFCFEVKWSEGKWCEVQWCGVNWCNPCEVILFWSEVMWSELTWFMGSDFVLKWSEVKCGDVEWTNVIHVKWFCFEVQWIEVSCGEVLAHKSTMYIRVILYFFYCIVTISFGVYLGCFNWFCNVWVCVCVDVWMFWQLCGCLLICVLVFTVFCTFCAVFLCCFVYVYLFLFVLSVLV